jgi:hypothetical protein
MVEPQAPQMLHILQRSQEGETPQRHYQNLTLPDFPFQMTPSKSPFYLQNFHASHDS